MPAQRAHEITTGAASADPTGMVCKEVNQPTANDLVRVAFGNVVNVRTIASRQVTRIEIDLPIESHIEATQALFGKDVLVVPANLPAIDYGMTDGRGNACAKGSSSQPGRPMGQAGPAESPRPARSSLGAVRSEDTLDIVRWLGARCTEDDFQDWLGVRTEASAVAKVREICGVSSRADIPSDRVARETFFRQIYRPFRLHQA